VRESRGSGVVWRVSRWVGLALRWFGLCAPSVCLRVFEVGSAEVRSASSSWLRYTSVGNNSAGAPVVASCRVNVHTNLSRRTGTCPGYPVKRYRGEPGHSRDTRLPGTVPPVSFYRYVCEGGLPCAWSLCFRQEARLSSRIGGLMRRAAWDTSMWRCLTARRHCD
jgi:hypothetical protein